jgi:ribosomal protein L11 methyltransferase
MNYICLTIDLNPFQPWNEIVMAQLAEIGFESFEEKGSEVLAYIQEKEFNEALLQNTILCNPPADVTLGYSKRKIASENWNANWEADYQPVIVNDQLIIAAPFHSNTEKFTHKILIQPQMSFGTGHHQTTFLIAELLLTLDLKDKIVFDIGTGTGVLAVLAEKLGAKSIVGTEIDDGSYENALENCALNNCEKIEMIKGDIQLMEGKQSDLLIANINRNVLVQHLPYYSNNVKPHGLLILSGFFTNDNEILIDAAKNSNFTLTMEKQKEGWSMLVFKKSA